MLIYTCAKLLFYVLWDLHRILLKFKREQVYAERCGERRAERVRSTARLGSPRLASNRHRCPAASINDLRRAREERRGEGHPEHLGGPKVDDERDLRRLLNRDVSRLCAPEHLVDMPR